MSTTSIYQKIFNLKKEVGKISKDSTNPFYNSKYFDVNQLLEHLEPLFAKYNFLCIQPVINGVVTTELIDLETNEKISSSIEIPVLTDPQKTGSAITYYRRYTLQSLLALQAEDDDANKASGKTEKKQTNADEIPVVWMNEKQLKSIISKGSESVKNALDFYDGKTERLDKDGKKVKYAMKKQYKEQLQKSA